MGNPANSSFDPYTQNITFLMADGVTPVTISLGTIDGWTIYDTKVAINWAAQLGALFIMFFVVLILTKAAKRRAPIFILNLLSLFFGFLRTLLGVLFFTSSWIKIYPAFSLDFSAVSGPRRLSVAATIPGLLMLITVLTSLTLQAHTVVKSMDNLHRHLITGFSVIIIALSIGFQFALTVTNIMSINDATFFIGFKVQRGALVTFTIAIWFFTLIFTGKLVYTLHIRRRNGWKQWSGVRILAAMGGCTMLIPSIFTLLNYVSGARVQFPNAGSLALTMVALLLPFSSLWASAAIEEEISTLNLSNLSANSGDARRGSETSHYAANKTCESQFSDSTGVATTFEGFGAERKGSASGSGALGIDSRIERVNEEGRRDSTEMDLERMGVRVDRSYSVHSGTTKAKNKA